MIVKIKNQPPTENIVKELVEKLDSLKAENIISIDVREKNAMADWLIICSGQSSRQVSTMAEKMEICFKEIKAPNISVEGKSKANWIIVSAEGIIIHIFREEVREYYRLEELWSIKKSPANN